MSETTIITVNIAIPLNRLRDLLVGAFEGGSSYWYNISDNGFRLAEGLKFDDFREGGKCQPEGDYYHWTQLIPSTEGCTLIVECTEEDRPASELNLKSMQGGIRIMSEKYPRHFANFMEENDDAETADVYLQCCLFGEVVFG